MKVEHLRIFSFLKNSCISQQEQIDRSKMILVKDLLVNGDLLENEEIKMISAKLTTTYNNGSEIVEFYKKFIDELEETSSTLLLGSLLTDNVAVENYLIYQEKYHELFYRYLETDIDDVISVFSNREQEKILSNTIDVEEKKLYKKIKTYKEGK